MKFLGVRVPLIEHANLPDWLQRLSVTEIHTRHITIDRRRIRGIVCDVRAKSFICAMCDVLIDAGVHLIGRYVQVELPPIDDRIMPKRKLVGRVRSIDGEELILEDILAANTGGNRDPRAYELQEIGGLVLKLYASNIDYPDRQTRALNLIDHLVERGFMDMQKLEAA